MTLASMWHAFACACALRWSCRNATAMHPPAGCHRPATALQAPRAAATAPAMPHRGDEALVGGVPAGRRARPANSSQHVRPPRAGAEPPLRSRGGVPTTHHAENERLHTRRALSSPKRINTSSSRRCGSPSRSKTCLADFWNTETATSTRLWAAGLHRRGPVTPDGKGYCRCPCRHTWTRPAARGHRPPLG